MASGDPSSTAAESHDTQSSVLSPQSSLGCLLLHGFTSSLATMDGLVPYLEQRGLPYRLPTLRGHGSTPAALHGVTWRDWYADADRALDELLGECERAVVVGLSMGGLVALHLAAERPVRLAGVVAVAPAMRLAGGPLDQLRVFLRAVRGGMQTVDARNAYEDAALAAASTNYTEAPARAILSLDQYGRVVKRLLPRITIPFLLIYTPRDRVVRPETARTIFDAVGTPADRKHLLAFDQCGHEMLLDRQRETVFAGIMRFIDGLRQAATEGRRGEAAAPRA